MRQKLKNYRKIKKLIEYSEVKNVSNTSFEDGELAKARKIARIMLHDNEPFEKIVRYTQLSVEQIEMLKNEAL